MVNAHKDEYDAKEVAQEAAKDGITFDETKIDKKGKDLQSTNSFYCKCDFWA